MSKSWALLCASSRTVPDQYCSAGCTRATQQTHSNGLQHTERPISPLNACKFAISPNHRILHLETNASALPRLQQHLILQLLTCHITGARALGLQSMWVCSCTIHYGIVLITSNVDMKAPKWIFSQSRGWHISLHSSLGCRLSGPEMPALQLISGVVPKSSYNRCTLDHKCFTGKSSLALRGLIHTWRQVGVHEVSPVVGDDTVLVTAQRCRVAQHLISLRHIQVTHKSQAHIPRELLELN